MDLRNLEQSLRFLIDRLQNGGEVEESKIEIKREWYDLGNKDKKVISEFLKDITSIANTPGVNGFLIIGLDQKTGQLFDSPFTSSGLRDVSDIYGLMVKFVDPAIDFEIKEFEMNGKTVTVFIIPPSLSKPHIISEYISKSDKIIQNYIPIRKVSGIYPANRSDIEFMFYDRKNIEPEYALEIKTYKPHLRFTAGNGQPFSAKIQSSLQNYGRKPIALVAGSLTVKPGDRLDIDKELVFTLYSYRDYVAHRSDHSILHRNLVVPSNQIETVEFTFHCQENLREHDKVALRDLLNSAKGYEFIIQCQDIEQRFYTSAVLIK